MSTTIKPTASFDQSLQPLRLRAKRLSLTLAAAIACLVGLSLLVTAMWLDLTAPLPVSVRTWVLPLSVLTAVLVGVLVWRRRRARRKDAELIRSVDASQRASGQVMAGYDLSRHPQTNQKSSWSSGLAALAGGQADQRCLSADPRRVLPSTETTYWWRIVGFAIIGLGLIGMFMPHLAWTQASRILMPSETQLPYSPSRIDVQPGDTEVLFGDDLEISVTVSGPPLESLELVIREDSVDGQPPVDDVLPMLEESDGKWRTFLTRIGKPAMYFVRARGARSPQYRLEVRMTPQFEKVTCRVVPPKYTRRGPYEGPIPKRGIEGLAGTQIEFTILSNRPLRDGKINVNWDNDQTEQVGLLTETPLTEKTSGTTDQAASFQEDSQTFESDASRRVRGAFQLRRSGKFSISIRDVDDIACGSTIDGVITLLHDTAPVVQLLQPRPLSLATPDVALPVVVAAEDDYGVSRLDLYRGLNQSPGLPRTLKMESIESGVRIGTSLPLSQYGLKPGDEITLYARAEDNDPAGAKGSESPVAVVRIISREQLAAIELERRGVEAIVSKQRRMQRMLDALRKELEKANEAANAAKTAEQDGNTDTDDAITPEDASEKPGDAKLSDTQPSDLQSGDLQSGDGKPSAAEAALQKLAQALSAAQSAAREAQQTAKQLGENPMPVDLDGELAKRMQAMAEELEKVAERLNELAEKVKSGQSLTDSEQQELQDLMKQMDDSRQQHDEQMMQPTSDFSKTLPLAADEQRFVQLVRRQRDLATRMGSLRGADLNASDVARRADQLRREQQQLQVALGDLLEVIESHVAGLPDDPKLDQLAETAKQFVQDVRNSQADPAMTDSQQGVLDADGEMAAMGAELAAEILEGFLSQCNAMGSQACKNCKARFKPSAGCPNPGNSIDQLLAKMGLGKNGSQPGMGAGNAAGGGYSTRRSTSENIGLYGGLPPESSASRRGSSDSTASGAATYSTGVQNGQTGTDAVTTEAAGARSDASRTVPSQYRNQVSDYFRTIAEELGDPE